MGYACISYADHGYVQYRNGSQTIRNSRVLEVGFANVSILNPAQCKLMYILMFV